MADRLKGLLDSARTKLGGLLGDFPQGFNAGAVAGIAGYPGDIAFMLDTAGRALTLQDTQPAARDFPGTTEYIAAKAGYPIPDSFSGQLGAAIGGVLTPGPGDLAKFAPVLSAIPFWHGSPHKFDAFDLAHMGKGEGAQAYGWGGYGAESPEVASQYAGALADAKRDTINSAIERVIHINNGDVSSIRDALILNGFNRDDISPDLVSAMADVIKNTDTDGTVNSAAIKAYDRLKEIVPAEANLYRGEYRWPDPAKEAATPLTGEDLLQWDRPLSEQPENVRKALAEASEVRVRPFGSRASDGSEFADVEVKLPGQPWSSAGAYLLEEATKVAADKQAVIDSLPFRGDSLYNMLARAQGGDDEASRFLAEAGIPGIRYLDGMSRTDGSGTHNLVMFSDKGIKLLERNGEKLGRQPITAYHKTDAVFNEFDPAFFGKNDNGYAGRGVYLTPKPLPGFTYGKDTLKVSAALENPYIRTKDSWNTDPLDPYTWIPKRTQELGGKPQDRTTASEEWTKMMRAKGHDGFIDEAVDGGEIVVFDPKKAKILERNGEKINAAEDFAARRAGKAKPYREAINGM